MTYTPPRAKRDYIKALWTRTADGKPGELVCHSCAKCMKQVKGNAKGTWFERGDESGRYCFVCSECYPK